MTFKINKKELMALIFILTLASFFRLYKLESIPPGIYPDEALNGNQAIHEPGKIFYPENNGREGLFMNLIALSFKIFGPSIWSFKIVSAISGILTVLGIYLLTKELFECNEKRSRYISLFTAFFLAVSFWHTNFSRISFRAIMVPLFSTFAFYFLFKAFKKEKVAYFIISGILFGLGLYTYIAFRMIILPLFAVLFFWWLIYRQKKQVKKFLFFIFYFLFFILLVASPLLFYFLKNPGDFIGRTQGVSIFGEKNPLTALARSFFVHLGMFNFYGDANWRHNVAGSPVLFWPVGILFLAGLVFSFKNLISSFKKRDCSLPAPSAKPFSGFTVHCSLIVWWFSMLLPGILTSEGIPHSLRCIGAIPPTFIFAGLGADIIYQTIKKRTSLNQGSFSYYLIGLSLFLLIFSFVFAQYFRYFELWAKNPETENAFSKDLVEIGNYLNSLPDETQKYVIVNLSGVSVNNLPMPAQTPIFIENLKFGHSRTTYLLPENIERIKMKDGENAIIIPMKYEENIFAQLLYMFPQGKIEKVNEIWIYSLRSN